MLEKVDYLKTISLAEYRKARKYLKPSSEKLQLKA